MDHSSFWKELGRSGVFTFLGLAALAIVVTILFGAIRPPTVDEVERDIWCDWARATVDDQGENIAGLVDRGRQDACQRLIAGFGRIVSDYGDDFVVRANVRSIRVLDRRDQVFAAWTPSEPLEEGGSPWRELDVPLILDGKGEVGRLQVSYKFNESTLESLPNIRRLAGLHDSARWLVAIFAAALLIAAIFNLQRLRERAARMQSQQVTLDLARQMCHELRNGLWAFSLEGKNLRQLFELVEQYFAYEPRAMQQAALRLGMSQADVEKLRRMIQRTLADEHLDPQTDVLSANAMAKDAQQQIESFSKYIHLTVEQLDRNLLGASSAWEPTALRLSDAWREACELLELRFHSAGVERDEAIETDSDWVVGDRRAIVHVFVNLAKNAIEAMRELPAGRRLTFQLQRSGNTLECRLHNVGRPIPPALLPFLFQRGFSTKPGAGRGIGLALVRESIERMNGAIDVESDQAGTRFTIRLPAADPVGKTEHDDFACAVNCFVVML